MIADDQPSPPRACRQQLEDVKSVMLVTPLWGRDGGVATHVQTSATALAQHGLEVHVLAARIHSSEPIAGVTVHHLPALLDRSVSVAARLGECLSLRPAVTHFHQLDDLQLVEPIRMNAPVAISAHAYPGCTSGAHYFAPGHECTRAHGPGCIPNLLARGCAHTRYPKTLPLKYRNVSRGLAALRRADIAVAYSTVIDRHLATNGVTRRVIVPCFPTIAVDGNSREPVPRRILFAGRVEQPKGVAVLIRAACEVDSEIVICGEGRQLPAMRLLAANLGVQNRIRFAGWLDPDQLAVELAAASVVVMPSLWPEPFGLVGIEALACGRPVVASATGGIVDWLQDDVGLKVAPGDPQELARALDELLSDPERQRRMGIAGKELVAARFSVERHVEVLLEAYRTARATWLAARRG